MGVDKSSSGKRRKRRDLRIKRSRRFGHVKDYDRLRVETNTEAEPKFITDKNGKKRRVNRWSYVTLAKRRGQYYRKHPENVVNKTRLARKTHKMAGQLLQTLFGFPAEKAIKCGIRKSFLNVLWAAGNAWVDNQVDNGKKFSLARDQKSQNLTFMERDLAFALGNDITVSDP